MNEEMVKTNCLIIGSGPAGYTAAIYAARADLKPILIEGMVPGGQLTTTTEIDNFPGYPKGISGFEMMQDLKNQALRFETDIRSGMVVNVDFSERPFKVTTDDNKTLLADTIIIATGAAAKYIGLPSEEKFKGGGVSACATCDGFFYKGQDVAVVGGSDTALEEASYLAHLCNKVYLIHRRDEFRASKAMQKRIFEIPNVEILWSQVVDEVLGVEDQFSSKVTGLRLKSTKSDETSEINVAGLFVAIGHKPNTDIFAGKLDLDEAGYIKTRPGSSHTSVSGVFAAGDVQDPHYRQAITSAGSGCIAAIDAERYLLD